MSDSGGTGFLALVMFSDQGWGGPLLRGAVVTLEISLCSYLFGAVLGLLGAWAKLSGSRLTWWIAEIYTTIVRAIPALLLVILLFYTGTTLLNEAIAWFGWRGVVNLSGFAAVVFSLGFIKGAYMTEVFRGAIVAVPEGVGEAAQALALPPILRFRLITFPLMLRVALPGMGNLWQSALKDSSLVSVVGFTELLAVGKIAASQTKYYLGFFCTTALIFLALAIISNWAFSLVGRRLNRGFA
jgi:polar amino acid transport system permease protein